MKYDFKTLVNRKDKFSHKWEMMDAYNKELAENNIPPFSVADYDFKYPKTLTETFKAYVDEMIFGYTRVDEAYYKSFIDWVRRRYNFNLEREWIVDANGVVASICNSIKTFTKENDGVIIMTPVYPPFLKSVKKNKRRLIENTLINKDGKYFIDFELLERQCQSQDAKMLILCSPHNPVGRVWTKAELEKIQEITEKNNVLVVSDEIHMDIILGDSKFISYASLNEAALNNSIILTSASKSFNLAGAQTSMVVIPNQTLRDKFENYIVNNCHIHLNSFGFKLVETSYNDCEEWFDELLIVIERNYNLMSTYISENHPKIIVSPLEGTYLLWLDFRAYDLSDDDLFEFLAKDSQIYLNRGDSYGDSGSGFMRWNIAVPTWTLEDALARLSKGLEALKG